MYQIQPITSDPLQSRNIILADGSTLTLEMNFISMQYGWFFTSITNGSFNLQGIRITNNLNILNQWRNLITFGIACVSPSGRQPSQAQDFSSGASNLYILTPADVQFYAEFLSQ